MSRALLAHDRSLLGIEDECGLLPSARARHVRRQWQARSKRQPNPEEEHVSARLEMLLNPQLGCGDAAGTEQLPVPDPIPHQPHPTCGTCGFAARSRETHGTGRAFCSVCGAFR
mmetsp:Transcript_92112/g.263978  ORF Transcript_92112/g.263978 Transcript_92112/m.263978 type:complete len:114 (+) Transcript_92112:668-1009(+)